MMAGLDFNSRRTAMVTCNAAVSCDNPIASQVGIDILKAGGNAADAAVAVAAAMNVTQPNTTGLGGDVFCLFYDAKTSTVKGLNGSGRTPSALTLDRAKADGFSADNVYPLNHGHTVTVPGAAAAWIDTIETFGSGKLARSQVLQPAVDIASNGFPVSEVCAHSWNKNRFQLCDNPLNIHGHTMLVDGQPPKYGQLFKNPDLANTIKEIINHGKNGYYTGRIAKSIVDSVCRSGGVMTLEDLSSHATTFVEPISVTYKGVRLWEIPPSGQGIVALMALNILENFDLQKERHNTAEYIHVVAEALKLAFSDAIAHVTDRSAMKVPLETMLSKVRAKTRAGLIKRDTMLSDVPADSMNCTKGSDTTYITVADKDGNACSFIASNYTNFGTGLVPEGCGFTLQNRGSDFSLEEGHANVLAANKRPYHTIIPAMLTCADTGALLGSYGVMGGYMQPQGHVQVLLNMLEFGMNPQAALDAPRLYVEHYIYQKGNPRPYGALLVEEGIEDSDIRVLAAKGYDVAKVTGHARAVFGRGHAITNGAWWSKDGTHFWDKSHRVLWTGTDPRCDGLAAGY